jgi:hypothetical protein
MTIHVDLAAAHVQRLAASSINKKSTTMVTTKTVANHRPYHIFWLVTGILNRAVRHIVS